MDLRTPPFPPASGDCSFTPVDFFGDRKRTTREQEKNENPIICPSTTRRFCLVTIIIWVVGSTRCRLVFDLASPNRNVFRSLNLILRTQRPNIYHEYSIVNEIILYLCCYYYTANGNDLHASVPIEKLC